MIGYYVHHVGHGHLVRARAVVPHLLAAGEQVTVLSSLDRPPDWDVPWVRLDRDDDGSPVGVTAGGVLHWAPRRHAGLAGRMAGIASWIARDAPSAVVVDLSVEVAVLARSCGAPVVVVTLPGDRTDGPHQLSFALADRVLAPWPDLGPEMCRGLADHRARTVHVGGISRHDGRMVTRRHAGAPRRALVLGGAGGGTAPPQVAVPGWEVVRCGPGTWLEDPWDALCAADVVISHCGLGALADIAAAGRPAVLVPDARPHGEQHASAAALRDLGCAVVLDALPADVGPALERALTLDTAGWLRWSDGRGAERAAAAVLDVARRP